MVQPGQHQQELVPTQAHREGRLSELEVEQLRDPAQRRVTDLVVALVVHRLEPVEVDERDRQRNAAGVVLAEHRRQDPVEVPAVPRTGQRVPFGELLVESAALAGLVGPEHGLQQHRPGVGLPTPDRLPEVVVRGHGFVGVAVVAALGEQAGLLAQRECPDLRQVVLDGELLGTGHEGGGTVGVATCPPDLRERQHPFAHVEPAGRRGVAGDGGARHLLSAHQVAAVQQHPGRGVQRGRVQPDGVVVGDLLHPLDDGRGIRGLAAFVQQPGVAVQRGEQQVRCVQRLRVGDDLLERGPEPGAGQLLGAHQREQHRVLDAQVGRRVGGQQVHRVRRVRQGLRRQPQPVQGTAEQVVGPGREQVVAREHRLHEDVPLGLRAVLDPVRASRDVGEHQPGPSSFVGPPVGGRDSPDGLGGLGQAGQLAVDGHLDAGELGEDGAAVREQVGCAHPGDPASRATDNGVRAAICGA